jgi:hypothetical protein
VEPKSNSQLGSDVKASSPFRKAVQVAMDMPSSGTAPSRGSVATQQAGNRKVASGLTVGCLLPQCERFSDIVSGLKSVHCP